MSVILFKNIVHYGRYCTRRFGPQRNRIFFYLFVYLASLGTWDLPVAHRLYWWHAGSLVAMGGLSCSLACGILVPQPRLKPVSPALRGRFLTHWTTREVSETLMKSFHENKICGLSIWFTYLTPALSYGSRRENVTVL